MTFIDIDVIMSVINKNISLLNPNKINYICLVIKEIIKNVKRNRNSINSNALVYESDRIALFLNVIWDFSFFVRIHFMYKYNFLLFMIWY